MGGQVTTGANGSLGIGMIGLGLISWVHEAGYNKLGDACHVVAVCDKDAEMATNRAALHDAVPTTDYRAVLEDPRVDVVDVTLPHGLHHEVALAAFAAGKHVIVEKPMAVGASAAREMIEVSKAAGLTLAVAENTRYVGAYRAAGNLLEQGSLGEIRMVRSLIAGSEVDRIRDPDTWHGKAPDGGVILDSAVHSLYLYRWLFGGIRDVAAHAWKVIPEGEMEDNALLLGRLAGGGEYQLAVSATMEIPWSERLEIYGCDGTLIVDQLTDPVVTLFRGGDDANGSAVDGAAYEPQQWKFTSMFEELADFVCAIRDGRQPLVDPEDTLYALEAAEAAYHSVEIGGVVELAGRPRPREEREER